MPRPNVGSKMLAIRVLPDNIAALDAYAATHTAGNRSAAINKLLETEAAKGDTVTLTAADYAALQARIRRAEELEAVYESAAREIARTKRRVKV